MFHTTIPDSYIIQREQLRDDDDDDNDTDDVIKATCANDEIINDRYYDSCPLPSITGQKTVVINATVFSNKDTLRKSAFTDFICKEAQ